jgi:nucleotide-binding universal stress UspA family protein
MRDRDRTTPSLHGEHRPVIHRLLFVADAAVAGADELPAAVRALIAAAAEIQVITPALPGRLAWLADDVDGERHVADERLETVLRHLRSIDAHAVGAVRRGSVLTVIADAIETFEPDHVLLALRSSDRANWQEGRLAERVEERFGVPLTAYTVDARGRASTAEGPLLLCFDGSDGARYAVRRAGELFSGASARVLTVWHPAIAPTNPGFETAGLLTGTPLDRVAARDGARIAEEGAAMAREAGFAARPAAVEAAGPVWRTIVEIADRDDAAAVVLGCRGLGGVRAKLLGSVSSAVVQHAGRPTLIIRQPVAALGAA